MYQSRMAEWSKASFLLVHQCIPGTNPGWVFEVFSSFLNFAQTLRAYIWFQLSLGIQGFFFVESTVSELPLHIGLI